MLPSYTSSRPILITPYGSGNGTPQDEEELAQLQRMDQGQMQHLNDSYGQPAQRGEETIQPFSPPFSPGNQQTQSQDWDDVAPVTGAQKWGARNSDARARAQYPAVPASKISESTRDERNAGNEQLFDQSSIAHPPMSSPSNAVQRRQSFDAAALPPNEHREDGEEMTVSTIDLTAGSGSHAGSQNRLLAQDDDQTPSTVPSSTSSTRHTAPPTETTRKDLPLEEALKDGEVRYREAERLLVTKDQALNVLQKFGVTPSTAESWAENQGINIEGGIWSHGQWNYLRSKYGLQGKSNREVAEFMSDKANATQARKELFTALGGKDKERLKVAEALSDLASLAALPLDIPKAASIPLLGKALAQKIGSGVKMKGLGPLKGPVDFKYPANSTPLQKAESHAYVGTGNHAHRIGALSPTGRVSTSGMKVAKQQAIATEKAAGVARGTPYRGVVGHGPDTTWTGNPIPPQWLDQSRLVNGSMGSQAAKFPLGFQPTGFTVGDPRSATPLFRMNLPPSPPPVVRPPLRVPTPPPVIPPHHMDAEEEPGRQ